MQLPVNLDRKRIDTEQVKGLFIQGERLANSIEIDLPIEYGNVDLTTLNYSIRGMSEIPETTATQLLEKTVTETHVKLQWAVTGEFTAAPGKMNLVLIGADKSGDVIVKLDGDPIYVRLDPTQGGSTSIELDVHEQIVAQIYALLEALKVVKILGTKSTIEELESDVTNPSIGDIYAVGAEEPYVAYVWIGLWTSLGPLRGPQGVDGVSLPHASEHAIGGDDPIPPTSIGALGYAEAQSLTAAQLGNLRINANIAEPNYVYSSREIPYTWAQIRAKIQAADFSGLRVGDYKDITLSGTFYDAAAGTNKTITNNIFRMEIAGIDSYYQYGDTSVPHHVDFISRDCLAGNLLYNPTDTNSGAFIGSALFTTLNGASGLQSLLPSEVAAVILNKRGLTEIKTGSTASGSAWNDMGKLWLPTEREVWGQDIWSEHNFGGGLAIQYPIFKDSLRHIIKGDGNGGARCDWWCASSMAGSAAYFCVVYGGGSPGPASAIDANVRVPLCFRVA